MEETNSDPNARVLSYHDVLLRRSDVELLKGPEWLNDQVLLLQLQPEVHSLHSECVDKHTSVHDVFMV